MSHLNNNTFGLFISNSNLNFKVEWIKNIDDYLFVNSTNEELIIFKKEEEELNKKYILLTNGQVRNKILDVFLVNTISNLVNIGKKVIVTISEKFILYFWNIKDGLCVSQVNISKFLQDKTPLIFISLISERFLVFFFKELIVVFDSIIHMIIKQQKLEFSLNQVFNLKENKYFLYSDKGQTFVFQLKEQEKNNIFDQSDSDLMAGLNNSESDKNMIYTSLRSLENSEIIKQFRRESLGHLDLSIKNTINQNFPYEKRGSNSHFEIKNSRMNFQYDKFIISINKSNFLIQTLFENVEKNLRFQPSNGTIAVNSDSLYSFNNNLTSTNFITFNNGNYIFHSQKNQLSVSYFNQFEEINLGSSIPSEAKYTVIFMNKFVSSENFIEKDIKIGDVFLFVIFKDLSMVIYNYNDKINQLEKIHKFYLMIEEEYFNMKYLVVKNLLIGYLEELIFIFDFDKMNFNQEEKYVDNTIELNNLFNKKDDPIHFTNYFRDNFKDKYEYYLNSVIYRNFQSKIFSSKNVRNKLSDNSSINKSLENSANAANPHSHSSSNGASPAPKYTDDNKKNSHRNDKIKELNKTFKITASAILSDPDNLSIYYIFGTDVGKIGMIDIFFDDNLNLNPIFMLNYHTSKINFMMIIEQKYLLASSDDGVISITDICKNSIERGIERFYSDSLRDSIHKAKKDSFNNVNNKNLSESKEHESQQLGRLINHSHSFISNRIHSGSLGKISKQNSNGSNALNQGNNFAVDSSDYFVNPNSYMLNPPSYFLNLKNYTFNGFISRRKSFKNNENNAHVTIEKLLELNEDDCLQKEKIHKIKKEERLINLIPILTMKNYSKLKKIMPIIFIDWENSNQDKQKNYYGIVLEDDSALIINTETMKIIYNFNINFNKRDVKGIYLKYKQKILLFYLGDGTLKLCNYTNKMGDREITDPNIIYNLLHVEDKMKSFFSPPDLGSFSQTNQKAQQISPNNNLLLEKSSILFDYEEFKKHQDSSDKKNIKNSYFDNSRIVPGSYGNNTYNSYINNNNFNNFNYGQNQINYQNTQTANKTDYKNKQNLKMEYILGTLETAEEKTVFLQKYFFNLYRHRKLELNFSQNKFDAYVLKKVEGFIIDKIYNIINLTTLPDLNNPSNSGHMFYNYKYINSSNIETVKKIEIFNLINNPNKYSKLNEKSNIKIQGVDSLLLLVGNQSLESVDFHLDEFIQFIERKVEKGKNAQHIISHKINYLNYISLFRIWNLSVDQDANFFNFLKIFQPIFVFNIILKGENNTLTLQLAEEKDIDGYLNEHFEFFKEYIVSNDDKRRVFKDDKYFDKKYLITNQKGYLVGHKNFNISTNISHLNLLALYSCMISILGFHESLLIQKLIVSEKNLIRSLSQMKHIRFTNFYIINKFFYEEFDDINLANKDVILFDYLCDKGRKHVQSKLEEFLSYIKIKHNFLFKDENEALIYFYKLNKEKNIDTKKLDLLNSYDLFLANCVITYDSIFHEVFPKEDIIKANQLLILLIFKYLKIEEIKSKYSKIIVEMLSKSVANLEIIYKENMFNYGKFLIELYTSIKVPIDLDGSFKKYDFDICTIIKSDSKFNFLKIMLAKQIKYFAKLKINTIIYLIIEEFKKKTTDYGYFSHLLEIIWLLFREKNPKYVQYLPSLVNLLVTNISPQNKDMKNVCLDYSKKILANLISYYPMISIDTQSQKLAVGANDGKIYIYDLSTGSFWKNLNAHQSEITALIFDNTGNIIISYSSSELNVKFWKIGLTNFLSNFFTSKNGYYQIKNLEPLPQQCDEKQKIDTVKFQSMPKGDNRILLIREDNSNVFMKL